MALSPTNAAPAANSTNAPRQPAPAAPSRAAAYAAAQAKKADRAAAAKPEIITEQKVVKPLSPMKAKIYGGVAKAFSNVSVGKSVKYGALLSTVAMVGVIVGVVIAPHLPALAATLGASAIFPPVMIAIGVTAGVALLAFSIYKFVQLSKQNAKLEAQVQAKKAAAKAAPAATTPAASAGASAAQEAADNAAATSPEAVATPVAPVSPAPVPSETETLIPANG